MPHVNGVNDDGAGYGVKGENTTPPSFGSLHEAGVVGTSKDGAGVFGTSGDITGIGVFGSAAIGVQGASANGTGVSGHSSTGNGLNGISNTGPGVRASSQSNVGVLGHSNGDNFGVRGESPKGFAAVHGNGGKNGVWGFTVSDNDSGVFGSNDGKGNGVAGFSKNGVGVLGRGGHLAARFEGDVEVTGDIRLANADCAEDFDVAGVEQVEPGTVMVLGSGGSLFESRHAYDKRVAGVISGAGNYKPGIVLDKRPCDGNRQAIALVGKVFCKVDARFGAVEVGDLLTTSPTPGHAMKAVDPTQAFGSLIGKALRPIADGQGLIPILVALQ